MPMIPKGYPNPNPKDANPLTVTLKQTIFLTLIRLIS